MNKYNSEDYFTVREKRTHKKICDCGNFEDARMMLHLDVQTREIVKNKTLMSPVVDIEMPKALPTNEIVAVDSDYSHPTPTGNKSGQLPQIKLPECQQEPFVV